MLITIYREYLPEATPGRLFINDGFYCHTLELPKFRCIPEGKYPLILNFSPRFRRLMPRILNVSGRDGILLHWGNFIKDTQGCPLVGYDKGKDANGIPAVFRSRVCFDELFNWLREANTTQSLEIELKGEKC